MTPPDSGERCTCPPHDRELQSRGLLLRHVKACPLRTVLNAPVPDSDEVEYHCQKCKDFAEQVTIPGKLAQRILAALELSADVDARNGFPVHAKMVDALAAELRERMPK